ncbi:ribbon-helix-helix protein, CopG family [Rhodococcus hoagii]|uniref:ribbon-helix-helix protein, CopG family n=1 Tax=Rhodococcus hoagii TaxID=43767 RepID=UPI0019646FCA|nr:ribbon-helix-helix protein, CopG family [Prescottella equi]MBM9839627.1 ribbon-helix-helix protein, CopG family [Prescottella equi]
MTADYDDDEIDDWPSQMGRTPIGPAIQVQFSKEAHLALCAAAEPFGQRRRSAVIRVAIGRLLADRTRLESLVREREANRATRPAFSSIVNMHLDEGLADTLSRLARDVDSNRTELIRIAVDRFLADLALLRLAGTPFDLETAVNAEIFNGEANRDLLIRRRQRSEAERLGGTATPSAR